MKRNTKNWGYGMDEDRVGDILTSLNRMYKDAYMGSNWDNEEYDMDLDSKPPVPKVNHERLLRDVMYDLHQQGQDSFMVLKNDQLREWWAGELAKIKKEEAKIAAREKAKSLLSEDERRLLGMKF
jgi:hypothetical protein